MNINMVGQPHAEISAIIIRANGETEDLGVISRFALAKKAINRLKKLLQ